MGIGRLTVSVYATQRVASSNSLVYWVKDIMPRTV